MHLCLHQIAQRGPAVTTQPMGQAVGFWQVVEEMFFFFLRVFRLEPPREVAGTQRRSVQLCGSARLKRCSGHQRRGLGEPIRTRFPLSAGRFRVAAHSFNRNRAPNASQCGRETPPGSSVLESEALVKKTLARMSSSCNYRLLPFDWAKRSFRWNRNADLG